MVEILIALISCATTLSAVFFQHKLNFKKKEKRIERTREILQNTFVKNVYLIIKKEKDEKVWEHESKSSLDDWLSKEERILRIVEDNFEFIVEFENKENINLDNMNKIKKYTEALNKEIV